MGLKEYSRKRRFDRTPEPSGRRTRAGTDGRVYVIQKHAASRLHYDLRLEQDGVLKSWAVPKGPSLDPSVKRLAVEVEDHPLDYAAFEGVIPKGEYGGGTVLLWDRGRWIPETDAADGFRKGVLKFRLEGEKLRGGWTLVRLKADKDGKPNWLLIKEQDEAARRGQPDIVAERPDSVATRRGLDEIASQSERVWHSDRQPAATSESARATVSSHALPGARRGSLPDSLPPQLATLRTDAPTGEDWLHEIKFDGYRIFCSIRHGRVRLVTRSGQDWTDRFAPVAEAAVRLPVKTAALDGEVVVLGEDGKSSFQLLQRVLSEGRGGELVYYAFDLLHLDGQDLTGVPLEQRKETLARVLAGSRARPIIRFADHVIGGGDAFYREACRLGLEGMISKRRQASYRSGRSADWLKIKCVGRQEFVIVGYTDPSGSRTGLGALLLGVYAHGRLRYAGKVGTGFSERMLAHLTRRLKPLEAPASPFGTRPPGLPARGLHWVQPELVAEVSFTEWTSDGLLRHPSFLGLREDKHARDITQHPQPAPASPPNGPVTVGGLSLSNPARVLYPDDGYTKLDLARYYEAVADRMLPHVAGRPLMILRCPEGHRRTCFHQKHVNATMPPAVHAVSVPEDGGTKTQHVMVDDVAGLLSLVQMGVLEMHVWGGRGDDIEHPDRLVFDLDPDETLPWRRIVAAAKEIRTRLRDLGLESWVKTTGGKGVHIVAPLVRRQTWEQLKGFAQALAEQLAAEHPDRYTSKMSKAGRRGKIFIDYLRNGRGATAIAAYSTRARPGAPVSFPIAWEELAEVRGGQFTIRTVPERLARQKEDPWKDFGTAKQALTRDILRKAGVM